MPDEHPRHIPRFRLCDLGVALKLGVTGLVLVLLGGFAASAAQLKFHHENRDEEPGVSLNDIRGAYRGVEIRAPLLTALERGHPSTISKDDSKVLVDWLNGGRISVDYDNLDLGDRAPAEIIARDCVSCHSEKAAATQPAAARIPLDTFDQVKRVAFTKKLDPPPVKILAMSTHAHALSLGALTFIMGGLLLCTRLPRSVTHGSCMLMGLALAADVASWWIVRSDITFQITGHDFHIGTGWLIYVIVGAGTIYNGLSVLSLVAIIVDTWIPRFAKKA